jgi:RimJ/RimL family protein N-acetyltransferase
MLPGFLESERLRFRAPHLDDSERISELINEPRVRVFLDHRVFPLTVHGERAYLEGLAQQSKGAPSDVLYAIHLPHDPAIIGLTGLHQVNWIARKAEWGLLVDPEHWGYGYGREIGIRILRYAFEELNLHRVYLRVHSGHSAGIHAYEGAGFQKEGLHRQAFFREGRYWDMFTMAAIRDDWQPQARKRRRA